MDLLNLLGGQIQQSSVAQSLQLDLIKEAVEKVRLLLDCRRQCFEALPHPLLVGALNDNDDVVIITELS